MLSEDYYSRNSWIPDAEGDWLEVNLLIPHNITGFIYQGSAAGFTHTFYVDYSNDGDTWIRIPSDDNEGIVSEM